MKKLLYILLFVPLFSFSQNIHQLGDTIQGGVLFYYDSDQDFGLISALEDLPAEYQWGCDGIDLGTLYNLGAGSLNTQVLINNQCGSEAAIAGYNYGGYDDWYLPSKEELELLFASGFLNPTTDPSLFSSNTQEKYYWSSTQKDINHAWGIHYVNGNFADRGKPDFSRVRPIRTTNNTLNTYLINTIDELTTSLSSLQQALDTWNTTIDLSAGWNMFGYGCPEAINLIDGVSNYSESIMIVKDDWGLAYLPEYGFNGIGDLTPGAGYQIKLSQAIDDFSLCDWYVNDVPEDNIVSLQEENDSLQAELDSIYGCIDMNACNFDETAVLDDGSCYNNNLGCGCDNPAPALGYNCNGNQLQVGDIFAGGIVFYLDESGQHGLISAMEDIDGGAYMWGCKGADLQGASGTQIGTGQQNSLDIISGCTETPIAASEALNFESNNYDDWYLPSKDELIEMYYTIGQGGPSGNIGNFYTDYFSSSEVNSDDAWLLNFSSGGLHEMNKDYGNSLWLRIRPIRSF